jgi:hypothetical protein
LESCPSGKNVGPDVVSNCDEKFCRQEKGGGEENIAGIVG